MLTARTVSYTHLDVYKRQPVRIAQIAHVEHQIGVARQPAREAEAQYVEHRLIVAAAAAAAEALAHPLLQIVCLLYTSRCV